MYLTITSWCVSFFEGVDFICLYALLVRLVKIFSGAGHVSEEKLVTLKVLGSNSLSDSTIPLNEIN